jgi:hypothetical protein
MTFWKTIIRKAYKFGFASFIIFFVLINTTAAQYAIKNGTSIAATDTTRILIVFAEIDFSKSPCPSNLPDNIVGNWPKNMNGKNPATC